MTPVGPDRWPGHSFIDMLPDAERTALLHTGAVVQFVDDQILLRQWDFGDFLYVLTTGKVKAARQLDYPNYAGVLATAGGLLSRWRSFRGVGIAFLGEEGAPGSFGYFLVDGQISRQG